MLIRLLTVAVGLCLTISAIGQSYLPGQFLIQLSPSATIDEAMLEINATESGTASYEVKRLVSAHARIYLVEATKELIATPDQHDIALRQMRLAPTITTAQLNHVISFRDTMPNDAEVTAQWHWNNTGQTGGTNDADVDAFEAWSYSTGGVSVRNDKVVVAVIDDGVNLMHPDLVDNLWKNEREIPNNNIDDDGNGYVDDYLGWNTNSQDDDVQYDDHGVAVCGMVGAVGNNDLGVVGAGWNTQIMTIKSNGLFEDRVISAYEYALTQRIIYNETNGDSGAFVVATNSSWGIDGASPDDYPLWCAYYDTLGSHGILSVSATTNDRENVDIVGDMPSNCSSEYLIVVTATNHNDVNNATGYGPINVDIGAPGINVMTTSANNGYRTTSGTSFASPLVAGIIGYLYSLPCSTLPELALSSPASAAEMVRDAILTTTDSQPSLVGSVSTDGRANMLEAANSILEDCGRCVLPYSVVFVANQDISVTLNFTVDDDISNTNFYYRPFGASTYEKVENIQSPYQLDLNSPCQLYEYYFELDCTAGLETSSVGTFTTMGCCGIPEMLAFDGDDKITWSNPDFYESLEVSIQAGQQSFTDLLSVGSTSYTLPILDSCVAVTLQLISNCSGDSTLISDSISWLSKGCGNCLDLSYCEVDASSTYEWIESMTFNNVELISPTNEGYYNHEDQNIQWSPTETINFDLNPGYAIFNYDEYFSIYADWNQDGFWSANERMFDPEATTQTTLSGQFQVPNDAKLGLTRCRVQMRYHDNGDPLEAIDACDQIMEGEIEDFCVELVTSVSTHDLVNDTKDYFQIYPNPNHGDFSIYRTNNAPETNKVMVYDMTGALQWSADWPQGNSNMAFDLQKSLPQGMYIVKINAYNYIQHILMNVY